MYKCRFSKFDLIYLILASFIIPNILFFIASLHFDFFRPLINIDYFLIFLIFLIFRSKIIFLILFLVVFTLDLFLILKQIYPLVFISDLYYLLKYTNNIPFFLIIKFLVLILLSIFVFLSTFYFSERINNNPKVYIIFLFFLILINIFTYDVKNVDNFFIQNRVLSFFIDRENQIKNQKSYDEEFNSPIYLSIIDKINKKTISKKNLLIINESYGFFKNKKITEDILLKVFDKRDKLDYINIGGFLYSGITIGGEFRELCNKNSKGVNFEFLKNAYDQCIPNILLKLNFNTIAYHAGQAEFYRRNNWYPKVGFEKFLFDKDFPELKSCKAFNGKCDEDLLPYIKSNFNSNDKMFVYWLTINTHEPYDEIIKDSDRIDCMQYHLKNDAVLCKNIKLQSNFFDQIATIIDDPVMKGVEVYIVGDHPPPLWNITEKKEFLYEGVGWLSFKIK